MTSETTLIAFDFDGTLAPICDDPGEVRIARGAVELLREAASIRGVAVAVVSGRDAADLASRIGVAAIYIVGSHGLEIVAPGGVVARDAPPLRVEPDRELLAEIDASGLRLERKKHAIALHWRGVPYAAIEPLVESFRSWGRDHDLDVIDGRCVAEARVRGAGKAEALRWVAAAVAARRVIYAGDDLTDFGPLEFAALNGRAFFMESAERHAPDGAWAVRSFRELFQLIREEAMI